MGRQTTEYKGAPTQNIIVSSQIRNRNSFFTIFCTQESNLKSSANVHPNLRQFFPNWEKTGTIEKQTHLRQDVLQCSRAKKVTKMRYSASDLGDNTVRKISPRMWKGSAKNQEPITLRNPILSQSYKTAAVLYHIFPAMTY